MDRKLIERINQLAHKQKTQGLSEPEKQEQQALRQQYLKQFRQQMKQQIEGIRVYDPKGQEITPDKVKRLQEEKEASSDPTK